MERIPSFEEVVQEMKGNVDYFINRPIFSSLHRLRVFHNPHNDEREVTLYFDWLDLGTVRFLTYDKSFLLRSLYVVGQKLGFNMCVQSLDYSRNRRFIIPGSLEDYPGAIIWATQVDEERDILFTCILTEIPLTQEEKGEYPQGGSWSLQCLLTEPDDAYTILLEQMN